MKRDSRVIRNPGIAGCAAAALLSAILLLAGCGKPEAPPPAQPEVTVMKMEAKDAPVTFEFVGITASSQQVEVRARVDGFLDDRLYSEGSIIQKGDVMFRMDAKPFEAQLDAAKAALGEQEAKLWTARADLKRVKPLAEANAVSLKELDDSRGRVNAAAAAVEMARADVETAQLNLGYTTIYAPVTGVSSLSNWPNFWTARTSALSTLTILPPLAALLIAATTSFGRSLRDTFVSTSTIVPSGETSTSSSLPPCSSSTS